MDPTRTPVPVVGRRTLLAWLSGLTATGLVSACGQEDPVPAEPRRLTAEEAELLAVARFQLHRRGTVPVRMSWPGSPAVTIEAELALDDAVGYGAMRTGTDDDAGVHRYLGWDLTTVATAPWSADAVPGRAGWSLRALSDSVPQDLFLTIALTLGADRPENALLLRQGSARFIRHDTVGGVDVMVVDGPRPAGDESGSRTRYWVDDDGDLRRFEAYLGDADGKYAEITVLDAAPAGTAAGLADVVKTVLGSAAGR